MENSKSVHIAFACSNKYSKYLATTLISLLSKFDPKRTLYIYILTEDFSNNSKRKFEKLKKYHNFQIKYIYLKKSDYGFLSPKIKSPCHVSRIAASRILLPNILDLEKILVLEVDQLINDDVSKLYDEDISNYPIAAVEDFASIRHSKRLWGKVEQYFNCGVILLNISYLKSINYMAMIEKKIKENGTKYTLQEQDIWNDTFRGHIKRLNIRWNLYHCYYDSSVTNIIEFKPYNESEYREACQNPGIYHFVSEDKCWFPTVEKPYTNLYRDYERKSPFYKNLNLYKYKINNINYFIITSKQRIIFKFSSKHTIKRIFSIENSNDKQHKIITILGLKIKIKRKNRLKKELCQIISEEVTRVISSELPRALSVQKLHSKNFMPFKNIHSRKNISIIGCGPSVKYYNNSLKSINIALNRALFLDNFEFTYMFVWDYLGFLEKTPTFFEDVKKYKKCIKFYGKFLNPQIPSIPEYPDDEINNIKHFYSCKRWKLLAQDSNIEIYPDIENYPMADFMSISFPAIQFALYTHPRKLYLIGLDTVQAPNCSNIDNPYNIEAMKKGYVEFKNFAKLHHPDTEIISVNPVGLKGMFRDVYTQSYVDDHPELLNEDIEILKDEELVSK